jgi:hypothetical protein
MTVGGGNIITSTACLYPDRLAFFLVDALPGFPLKSCRPDIDRHVPRALYGQLFTVAYACMHLPDFPYKHHLQELESPAIEI